MQKPSQPDRVVIRPYAGQYVILVDGKAIMLVPDQEKAESIARELREYPFDPQTIDPSRVAQS